MLKFLYAIAKAIPALQKILDKFFGVAKESKASSRRVVKDAAVDAAVKRVRKRKPKQQRKANAAPRVRGSSTGGSSIHNGSPQDNKSSGV